MKKLLAAVLALAMSLSLAACGGGGSTSGGGAASGGAASGGAASGGTAAGSGAPANSGPIHLRMWGAEEDQTLLGELVEKFKQTYSDYTFEIEIGVESESTAKDTILTDVEAAADVYAFASDQLPDLVKAGAILDLSTVEPALTSIAGKSLDDIRSANTEASIEAATYNGSLYAFPFASDGYFLFYDTNLISPEQAANWSTLLEAAQAGGKKVGMTLASGWYNACFFYGAGFTTKLNDDGSTTIDWNGTSADGISGVDVVKAMQAIAGSSAFLAVPDNGLAAAINAGNLAAVVSGTWDTSSVAKQFGDNFGTSALPAMDINGTSVPCRGVVSSKLIGVNPHAENTGWAVLLAEFLTNEESQIARFEARQLVPTNINASNNDAVLADKGAAGLVAAGEVGQVQSVGGKFWDPVASFGEQIAQGTIGSDDAAIQTALDQLVEGVNVPVG